MFAYIKGTVSAVTHEYVVVEAGGIGYRVNMPFSEISRLPAGQETQVFTYLYLREGIMDLYGFISTESLHTFELLLSVSGVGPKAAIAVLSVLTPAQLALALTSGDYKSITKAPGIGAKIAQRMVLELKDKLKSELSTEAEPLAEEQNESVTEEAVNALIVLGYAPNDAKKAVMGVKSADTVEQVIKEALKALL